MSKSRIISLGIIASLLFSVTFVVNRTLAISGGSWIWTSAFRYAYLILLLTIFFLCTNRSLLTDLIREFLSYPLYWIAAGTLGCGIFYTGLCYGSNYCNAWLVAATWQSTILFSPLIMRAFGNKVSGYQIARAVIILIGVFIANYKSGINSASVSAISAILCAALAYPIGNQLLNRAMHRHNQSFLFNPLASVLLMSMGSVPFFVALILLGQPGRPIESQFIGALVVALFSGIAATSLFFYARNYSTDGNLVSMVDSTQAGEVIFTLLGELLLLHLPVPSPTAWIGLILIFIGLLTTAWQPLNYRLERELVSNPGEIVSTRGRITDG